MNNGIIQKPVARNFIFRPMTLFFVVWNVVLILYSFHFSELLYFTTTQAFLATYFIICSFFIGWLIAKLGTLNRRASSIHVVTFHFVEQLKTRKNHLFTLWVVLTFIEVIYCGGVPVIWLILGNGKTYFDFGIPTVHGLLNSLILSLSLISYYLYLVTNNKKNLLIPFSPVFGRWSLYQEIC